MRLVPLLPVLFDKKQQAIKHVCNRQYCDVTNTIAFACGSGSSDTSVCAEINSNLSRNERRHNILAEAKSNVPFFIFRDTQQ